jgi:hypothetical protein
MMKAFGNAFHRLGFGRDVRIAHISKPNATFPGRRGRRNKLC